MKVRLDENLIVNLRDVFLSVMRMYVCVSTQVLPPLRDVKNRPEVGNALRNKLVRLMTHIDTDVKHCAAEFLFVLCKESGTLHYY